MTGVQTCALPICCMNIHQGGKFDLYAGGGLLAESEMEKEWLETEAKMQTMRKVVGT